MENQMKIKLEEKRKRGRPTGRNRIPLSAEERRARNAQYERERREQQAEAMLELADAMGCDPTMSNADVIATVVSYISRVSSNKTVSNDDLKRQNETLLHEIDLFKQQWGLSIEDESDTSDSGVIVESGESEAYDSGDSSSRPESRLYSTSSVCSQTSANCGQLPANLTQGPVSFGHDSASYETILGISQGPVNGAQNTNYDQASTDYNQSAAKRLKTSGGYVEVSALCGEDSAGYVQHPTSFKQEPASYKQERASDEESSGRYVQEYSDHDHVPVSYGQPSASYVQPLTISKQESFSDEENTDAGFKQESARTSPYVESGKRFKLERASSAASAVSENSPQNQHVLEGSVTSGLMEEPTDGAAKILQEPWSQAPSTWHQAQPKPWPQTYDGPQSWSAHGVPSPQGLQVPCPQPSSDPWIDTLIKTYLF